MSILYVWFNNAFLNMFNEYCCNKKKQGIDTQESIPIKIWLSHKNQPNMLQFNEWQGKICKKKWHCQMQSLRTINIIQAHSKANHD